MKHGFGLSVLVIGLVSWAEASEEFQNGVMALQQRKWTPAMGAFLNVLSEDSQHAQAHAYLGFIAREVQSEQSAMNQKIRLDVLMRSAQQLEAQRGDPRPIEQAIQETTQADERNRTQRWDRWCEEAQLRLAWGHLLPAYDLVLKTLSENSNYAPAQRLLSELQSRTQGVLQNNSQVSAEERFSLEGFRAYGDAEYEAALTAWLKTAQIIGQAHSASEAAKRKAALFYEPYRERAQALSDVARHRATAQSLFKQASQHYSQRRFIEALQTFRRVAILNPDYPQLGFYLAQAESAVDKDRARRLGESKQKEMARLYDLGFAAFRDEHYRDAELIFKKVLGLDAAHTQARAYLSMVQAELHRRHDPKAAQEHYESGLIAYASGRLEEALREWKITARMNPDHHKAQNALSKVRKELAMNHEIIP